MANNSNTWLWEQNGGVNGGWRSSGSRSNFAINSAFVVNTSGAVMGWRYFCPVASPIVNVYFIFDTSAGTYANLTFAMKIQNESTASASRAGTTTRESSTGWTKASAVDQWNKVTFAGTYTPNVGEILWLCLHNTAGAPATDYANVLTHGAYAQGIYGASLKALAGYTSAAGFSANGTAILTPIVVVEHADGSVYGNPFSTTSSTYYTNNTRKRGIYIPPMLATREIVGAAIAATASCNGLQLFTASQVPNDTPLQSWACGTDAKETMDGVMGYKQFDTPVVLQEGQAYRFVQTFSGNVQVPQVIQIENYSAYSSIFDQFYGGTDVCYSTIDSGSNTWTDDKAVSPAIALIESRVIPRGRYIGG